MYVLRVVGATKVQREKHCQDVRVCYRFFGSWSTNKLHKKKPNFRNTMAHTRTCTKGVIPAPLRAPQKNTPHPPTRPRTTTKAATLAPLSSVKAPLHGSSFFAVERGCLPPADPLPTWNDHWKDFATGTTTNGYIMIITTTTTITTTIKGLISVLCVPLGEGPPPSFIGSVSTIHLCLFLVAPPNTPPPPCPPPSTHPTAPNIHNPTLTRSKHLQTPEMVQRQGTADTHPTHAHHTPITTTPPSFDNSNAASSSRITH